MCFTGYVSEQGQSCVRHDNHYIRDVTTLATSRDPHHFRSQGRQQPANCRKHSDDQPTDHGVAPADVTSLGSDVTSAATTSGLSSVADLLDEAPLFYVALTSGASFAACASSVCPSCVVALVAVTSFVSFVVDSTRRYIITNIVMR